MQAQNRSVGRPSSYGFDLIMVGETIVKHFKDICECERMRASALAHARRSGKKFTTKSTSGVLNITRSE